MTRWRQFVDIVCVVSFVLAWGAGALIAVHFIFEWIKGAL